MTLILLRIRGKSWDLRPPRVGKAVKTGFRNSFAQVDRARRAAHNPCAFRDAVQLNFRVSLISLLRRPTDL